MIRLELQALFGLADPERPYSGMARQLLRDLAPGLVAPEDGDRR